MGTVVAVRGSVVDVRVQRSLPPIYTVLRTGPGNAIVIEVLAQLNTRIVRGIARVFRGEKPAEDLSERARDYWLNRARETGV